MSGFASLNMNLCIILRILPCPVRYPLRGPCLFWVTGQGRLSRATLDGPNNALLLRVA